MTRHWWAPVTTLLAIVGAWICVLACWWLYGWQAALLALMAATLARVACLSAAKMRER